eukprot:5258213-Amphidinium_carterae.1
MDVTVVGLPCVGLRKRVRGCACFRGYSNSRTSPQLLLAYRFRLRSSSWTVEMAEFLTEDRPPFSTVHHARPLGRTHPSRA